MISPGMHYGAGLCRPAGGGSCSPAFCAAGSTTVVFYKQHVLKSMLKLSHSRMLSCGVLRVHDSQPRSSRMRKCLNVDLLSTQAYSCKCLSPRLFSAADMSLKCANMGTARIDFRQLGDCGLYNDLCSASAHWIHPTPTPPCDRNTPQQHQRPQQINFAFRVF